MVIGLRCKLNDSRRFVLIRFSSFPGSVRAVTSKTWTERVGDDVPLQALLLFLSLPMPSAPCVRPQRPVGINY